MYQQDFNDSLKEEDMWFDKVDADESKLAVPYSPMKGKKGVAAFEREFITTYTATYSDPSKRGTAVTTARKGIAPSDYLPALGMPEVDGVIIDYLPINDPLTAIPFAPATTDAQGNILTAQRGWPASVQYEPEILASPAVEEVIAYRRLRTSIEIHVFSESLQQGIILVVQFVVSYNDEDTFDGPDYPKTAINFFPTTSVSVLPTCGMCVTYNAPEVPEVPEEHVCEDE